MNSGYVGYSRSVRSQDAIESYEMPLSMISKDVIESFIHDHQEEFSKEDVEFLKKLSVAKWRFAAKRAGRSSWHHTSSHFNETDHYDLFLVAEQIILTKDRIDSDYATFLRIEKEQEEREKRNYKFGVLKAQVWGGSRRRPKLIGHETVAGIVLNGWLHTRDEHNKDYSLRKHKISANKVEWIKEYDSYEELIKEHKQFRSTKRVFNSIIKEKIK